MSAPRAGGVAVVPAATSTSPARASSPSPNSARGPLIYHEGARYRVYKVNLDFGSDAIEDTHHLATETMKRCERCGYDHLEAGDTNLAEMCDRCGAALDAPSRIDRLVQMQNVTERTTLLIARFRYHLRTGGSDRDALLCEEIVPLACTGTAEAPCWLSPEESEHLLTAHPERNLLPTALAQQLDLTLPALAKLRAALEFVARERAEDQREAHERVRAATRAKGRVSVEPFLPVDLLGVYVLLPRLV